MYKRNAQGWSKHIDFIILDIISQQVAFILASLIRHQEWPYMSPMYRNLGVALLLINAVVMMFLNTFHDVLKRDFSVELYKTITHCVIVLGLATTYMFSIQTGYEYSRVVLFITCAFHIVIGYTTRMLWKQYIKRHGTPISKRGTMLVVLEPDTAEQMMTRLLKNHIEGYEVMGVVLNEKPGKSPAGNSAVAANGNPEAAANGNPEAVANGNPEATANGNPEAAANGNPAAAPKDICGVPVVATIEEASRYISTKWIDEVYIDCPATDPQISKLMDDCHTMAVPVHYHVPAMSRDGVKQFVEKVGGTTVLTTSINYATPLQNLMKRALDIIGGVVGSIIAVLIIIVVGPIIKKQSPGPIIFKQTRIGRNGKQFQIYKLRSMYMDAEERKKELMENNRVKDGMMFKLDFDPRIIGNEILPDGTKKTGIGEFIRKTSLDEFPQFFNVLRGQMSLVGTRPPTVDEWEKYEFHHRARLACKPGITGMWQVSGRSEITDFEEVVKLDTKYITNWSFGLDLRILMKTVWIVLTGRGAM